MKTTPEIIQKINDLDCMFRFTHVAETYETHPISDKPVIARSDKARKPGVYCQIIDKPTGEVYAEGYGAMGDETAALNHALEVAMLSPKPLTKAQKLSRDQVNEAIANTNAENAELRRQLAELQAQVAELANAGRGRKKSKSEPEPDVEPASV